MNREIEIHVDLDGRTHLTGRLWSRLTKGREGPLLCMIIRGWPQRGTSRSNRR
jgi:hypothetical protein